MKEMIVTADDFGLSQTVNQAIEEAHCHGILTTASLMIGGEAAADAVSRARRLPRLGVGLHLVVADGPPVLPSEAIPELLNGKSSLSPRLTCSGMRFFFSRKVKEQLEAEIRAQFRAFHETGLILDHVNTHHHMHLHPTVLGLLLKIGKEYGLGSIRVPYEPLLASRPCSGKVFFQRLSSRLLLFPWMSLLRKRLREEGVSSNDSVFGISDSGSMELGRVLWFLDHLPEGVTEIYFHPGAAKELAGMTQSDHELEILTHPQIRKVLLRPDIRLVRFRDLQGRKISARTASGQ